LVKHQEGFAHGIHDGACESAADVKSSLSHI
jgi:hypothetical protein